MTPRLLRVLAAQALRFTTDSIGTNRCRGPYSTDLSKFPVASRKLSYTGLQLLISEEGYRGEEYDDLPAKIAALKDSNGNYILDGSGNHTYGNEVEKSACTIGYGYLLWKGPCSLDHPFHNPPSLSADVIAAKKAAKTSKLNTALAWSKLEHVLWVISYMRINVYPLTKKFTITMTQNQFDAWTIALYNFPKFAKNQTYNIYKATVAHDYSGMLANWTTDKTPELHGRRSRERQYFYRYCPKISERIDEGNKFLSSLSDAELWTIRNDLHF